MRYIIIYSLFLIFVYSCTTVKVAREAGKAIKSIDNTITLSEKEKNNSKYCNTCINDKRCYLSENVERLGIYKYCKKAQSNNPTLPKLHSSYVPDI